MPPPRVDGSPVVVAPKPPPPPPPAPVVVADAGKPAPVRADAFDAPKADPTKAKLDQVEKDLTPTYTVKVDGKDVSADVPTPFRMNGGINQPTPEEASKKMTDTLQKGKVWPKDPKAAKELQQAILQNAYGRATPKQIQLVTNKLIDAGALKPYLDKVKADNGGKVDAQGLKTAIRRMQWENGVGSDCNGVCRIAYSSVNGKPASAKWGDALIPTGANGKSLNPNFKKVDVTAAKPGDMIKLDDVTGDVGHNVVITDAKTVSAADAGKLSGSPKPTGPLKQVTVMSSWGAGGDEDNPAGGLNKQTWVYDEGSKKWGELKGNNVEWSKTDGPYGHKFVGVYTPVK